MIDPHKPLRDDVRLLGELLGDTIRAEGGDELFDTVERVRTLSKSGHAGHDEDFDVLAGELARLPVTAALPVARAFAHFLNLANIAEQHHRIRRRRAYQRDPAAPPQRGSCADDVRAGSSPPAFRPIGCTRRSQPCDIELVLTAHPTEIARRTLVQKYNRIAATLMTRDRPDLTVPEQEELLASLRREIATAWATNEVRQERPSPLDEVRSGLSSSSRACGTRCHATFASWTVALRAATGQRPAARIDADPFRIVDRRRSGRQPERDAAGHAAGLPARALGRGGVSTCARSRRCGTSCPLRPPAPNCGRMSGALRSRIASCSARCAGALWPRAIGSKPSLEDRRRRNRHHADVYLDAADLRDALQLCARSLAGHRARRSLRRAVLPTCSGASPFSASRWLGSTYGRMRRGIPRRSPR